MPHAGEHVCVLSVVCQVELGSSIGSVPVCHAAARAGHAPYMYGLTTHCMPLLMSTAFCFLTSAASVALAPHTHTGW